MDQKISLKDLPSVKFENELKDKIQYKTLEDYVTRNPTDEQIDEWISNFESNIHTYLMEHSVQSLINEEKGCKDFNYFINDITQKIRSFRKEKVFEAHKWATRIKSWNENYPKTNLSYKCNKNNIYYDDNLKKLYDLCIDSEFVNQNKHKLKNMHDCQSIIDNMSIRYNELVSIRQTLELKRTRSKIPDTCSAKNLEKMLPNIDCKSITEQETRLDEFGPGADHLRREKLEGTARAQSWPGIGEIPNTGEDVLKIPGENGENNSIGLVSLPILGVFVLSFFLYKYTPLGSKFHSYFQNKGNISINQDYEATNKMLCNTSNLNDMYSENIQYDLSYQTL
ncbi:PIR Superfamily Protein [Plasmodium ovale wallikeri]|uniref:Plasmodium vivax Vir protein, putative n=2 Tax=Plasmodium ovale TaxID=36330 RepID=A0A1C3KIP2_PLAOA|nr:PIR Superfamily Protein [Plasmodium ovale wallikeri]SBT73668.1 Plasmodium vivax Vir protein, putative [Plasmodium ovale]